MLENRSLKRDLLALALLAGVIFLAAALFSYDPADPPGKLVFPPHSQPANACGYWGAVISRLLFEAVGIGAYYVVISLAAFDVVLLLRREITLLWLRTIGWLLSLAGVTTLAALAVPWLSPGPVIGAGGYFGVTGRALLQTHFASVGSYILSVSLLLGGLLLSTDYALVRLFIWIVGKSTGKLGRGVVQVSTAYAQKLNKRRSDLDDFEVVENGGQMAIRMAGKLEAAETDAKTDAESEPGEIKIAKPAGDAGKALGSRVGISRTKPKDNREVLKELDESVPAPKRPDYELPSLDLLVQGEPFSFDEQEKEVRRKAKILEKTFLDFGFNVKVVEIQTGPVIAQFEVELEAGLRLSKITGLADDLAIALRVPSVRIVAPLPGKNTVGVEVPNNERQLVHLREVMEEGAGKAQKMRIPVYLGKDVAGAHWSSISPRCRTC